MTVATVGHVAHVWLLLTPIAAMGRMTSDDHCYFGTCGMHVVSISTHNNDELSDISGSLQLPLTVAMGYMTSDDCCYCWKCGTQMVYTSPHSNNWLAVHCYWTASSDGLAVHYYWTTNSDGLAVRCNRTSSSNGLSSVISSLLDCIVAMA
jgi:hypothetical protein